MTNGQPSRSPLTAAIHDDLILAVRQYRRRANMTQSMFAYFAGVSHATIKRLERHEPITDDTAARVREFLAQTPQPRNIRSVTNRPPNIYLTKKLLTWARITDQPSEGVEAVRALKEAYERAKRDEGLASIPLIQLEVENALTLATRGAYYKERRR